MDDRISSPTPSCEVPTAGDGAAPGARPGLAVEVAGLFKAYGPRPALRDVDLSLAWGESLTLFGPNGSGKTTLIKVLASLAGPTSGVVRIGGLELRHQATWARGLLGMAGHNPFLYPDLTGSENLKFTGRLFGLRDLEARVAALSGDLGLGPLLHRRVRTLSHGTQKRLDFARALLHRPPLLLLDEPETGLDGEALGSLRAVLARHVSAGGAVIATSHNTEGGLALGGRTAILYEGRITHQNPADGPGPGGLHQAYARITGAGR